VRLRTVTSEHELLIDRQRYLVLRYKQTAQSGNGKVRDPAEDQAARDQ